MIMDKDQLEEVLEDLKSHKGKATELITVYVSEGYDVNVVQRQLEGERGTSKGVEKDSLERQFLVLLYGC